MKNFNFLLENWYMFVVFGVVVGFIGVVIGRFYKLPRTEQLRKLKEWLLWAVTEAEKELGSGTGQLKLRYVYDLFLTKFPAIADMITFDLFSKLVDDALDKMRHMIDTNKAVKEYVEKTEAEKE